MTPDLKTAAQAALTLLEEYEVKIDREWGMGRTLAEIESRGDLPAEIRDLRAAIAATPSVAVNAGEDANAFKAAMKTLGHVDRPGFNLWRDTSVFEKSLMLKAWNAAITASPAAATPVAAEPNKALVSALNAMLTQFGMDEDEWSKPTFDQARAALAGAGPAEPADTVYGTQSYLLGLKPRPAAWIGREQLAFLAKGAYREVPAYSYNDKGNSVQLYDLTAAEPAPQAMERLNELRAEAAELVASFQKPGATAAMLKKDGMVRHTGTLIGTLNETIKSMTGAEYVEPAGVPELPSADDVLESLAFESTNNTEMTPMCKHWWRKGLAAGRSQERALWELTRSGEQIEAMPAKPCGYCDDTGYVTRADGEWLGRCTCPAGAAQPSAMPDAGVDAHGQLDPRKAADYAREIIRFSGTDPVDAALDPQRAVRVAREALAAHYAQQAAQASRPIGYVAQSAVDWLNGCSGDWCVRVTISRVQADDRLVPLYAAPAKAAMMPMTDEQAKEVLWQEHLRWMEAAGLDTEGMRETVQWLDHFLTYARAIERAHGIGIPTNGGGSDAAGGV